MKPENRTRITTQVVPWVTEATAEAVSVTHGTSVLRPARSDPCPATRRCSDRNRSPALVGPALRPQPWWRLATPRAGGARAAIRRGGDVGSPSGARVAFCKENVHSRSNTGRPKLVKFNDRNGSPAGSRVLEKLPLKTKKLISCPADCDWPVLEVERTLAASPIKKLTSSIAVIDHRFIMRPVWVGSSRSRGWNLTFDARLAPRAVDRWTPAARSTQSSDRNGTTLRKSQQK